MQDLTDVIFFESISLKDHKKADNTQLSILEADALILMSIGRNLWRVYLHFTAFVTTKRSFDLF